MAFVDISAAMLLNSSPSFDLIKNTMVNKYIVIISFGKSLIYSHHRALLRHDDVMTV